MPRMGQRCGACSCGAPQQSTRLRADAEQPLLGNYGRKASISLPHVRARTALLPLASVRACALGAVWDAGGVRFVLPS